MARTKRRHPKRRRTQKKQRHKKTQKQKSYLGGVMEEALEKLRIEMSRAPNRRRQRSASSSSSDNERVVYQPPAWRHRSSSSTKSSSSSRKSSSSSRKPSTASERANERRLTHMVEEAAAKALYRSQTNPARKTGTRADLDAVVEELGKAIARKNEPRIQDMHERLVKQFMKTKGFF